MIINTYEINTFMVQIIGTIIVHKETRLWTPEMQECKVKLRLFRMKENTKIMIIALQFYKIVSTDVKGLNRDSKCRIIHEQLANNQAKICFAQETFSKNIKKFYPKKPP